MSSVVCVSLHFTTWVIDSGKCPKIIIQIAYVGFVAHNISYYVELIMQIAYVGFIVHNTSHYMNSLCELFILAM